MGGIGEVGGVENTSLSGESGTKLKVMFQGGWDLKPAQRREE
jgi:hypothetical protein